MKSTKVWGNPIKLPRGNSNICTRATGGIVRWNVQEVWHIRHSKSKEEIAGEKGSLAWEGEENIHGRCAPLTDNEISLERDGTSRRNCLTV